MKGKKKAYKRDKSKDSSGETGGHLDGIHSLPPLSGLGPSLLHRTPQFRKPCDLKKKKTGAGLMAHP